ncbi:hypothetical protein DF186_23755, partial [Enterococcus hirae]
SDTIASDPLLRIYLSLENPTGAPIDVEIEQGSDLGSDSATVIEADDTGDSLLTAADKWVLTSDAAPFDDPLISNTFFGE